MTAVTVNAPQGVASKMAIAPCAFVSCAARSRRAAHKPAAADRRLSFFYLLISAALVVLKMEISESEARWMEKQLLQMNDRVSMFLGGFDLIQTQAERRGTLRGHHVLGENLRASACILKVLTFRLFRFPSCPCRADGCRDDRLQGKTCDTTASAGRSQHRMWMHRVHGRGLDGLS